MQKRILAGIAGIGLLAVLPACSAQKQSVTEDMYAAARTAQTGSEPEQQEVNTPTGQATRNVAIPLLQIDAQAVYNRMINYIAPDEELAPKVVSRHISVYVDFPAGGVSVNPGYGNNRAELVKLEEHLKPLLQSDGGGVTKIRITGYASPDGNTKENERLAGNRSIQFKNYLQKQFKLPDNGLVTVDWVGEDWDGLKELISKSDKKYSSRVLAIFQLTDDPDSRRKQIRAIDNGAVYKDIEKSFFGRLRRMELTVETQSQIVSADNFQLIELIYSQPDKVSLTDYFRVASLYRPGTDQYREVYELAAYTYPSCVVVQLNAAAAALSQGDTESARYFFNQVGGDQRAYNNLGVLSLMDGDKETAMSYFKKSLPQNPKLARENMEVLIQR
ncbi:OmpA family protein [uncultured Parabacteroides sp.]|jgi:outer membrane protein OmpA-like peptidoglycan-associated protein|uniref:OmpA family protein n=1 Tax=uncultured Parabacteroides sp. TaxID=512312 RepID=UPI0025DBBC26|nr:OmpA family protein [uncultured Parabacteroides sp.]